MMLAAALALLTADAPPGPPAGPREVVQAMFDAFNRHDVKAMARLYGPGARLTSPDFCKPRGKADVERTYAALFEAFPDLQDSVEVLIAEGDRVAVRFTAKSAAGNFTLPVQAMLRVEHGLIVEDDSVFDTGGKPCEP